MKGLDTILGSNEDVVINIEENRGGSINIGSGKTVINTDDPDSLGTIITTGSGGQNMEINTTDGRTEITIRSKKR